MLKRAPSAFFAFMIFAAVTMAVSATFPGECLAQNSASSFAGQSGYDPNRPPSAQRSSQRTLVTATENASANAPSREEKILFDHVNESRVLTGLPALHWDANLAAAARQHCALLVRHKSLSHQFPEEEALQLRARHAGAEFSVVAENVAIAPTPDEIHYEWMNSPGHRANILDPDLTAVGIAVMPGSNGLYAVQDFSQAIEELTLDEQEEKIRAFISATGVRTADNPDHTQWSDARKTCQMADGYAGKPSSVVRFETSDLSQLPARLQKSLASGKFRTAAVGACATGDDGSGFTRFRIAVLLY